MKSVKNILIFCFFLFIPGLLPADSGPDILLLNSNRSVEKYNIAQEEFKKSIAHKVSEFTIEGYPGEISDLYRLISRKPHQLIYCIGTKAYLAAHKYAPEKNIIFSSIMNWRRLPEGEAVFGISNELHPMMQLTHFKNIFPDIRRIGVLYSREFNEQWIDLSKDEAKKAGIQIISKTVTDIDQSIESLEMLLPEIDALWLIPDPIIISGRKNLMNVIEICDNSKKPVFSYNDLYVKIGVTLVVSVDDSTIGRQIAVISDDILAGRKIPQKVQLPAGSNITLNFGKVKAFGLRYNEDALDSVNQIIDPNSMNE